MKTRILIALIALIASMLVGRADRADNKQQQVPVVVPVRGCGTVTTSKFGDGCPTAPAANKPSPGNVIILPAKK